MAELENDEQKSEFLKKVFHLADKAMRAHNLRLDEKMIREALKPIFQNPERRKNMIVSLFEEKFLAGEAKGKAEGKIEGKIEGKTEAIFLYLTDRFGGISKKLEKKVQKINDPEKLNELIKLSARCESLKEFENALD